LTFEPAINFINLLMYHVQLAADNVFLEREIDTLHGITSANCQLFLLSKYPGNKNGQLELWWAGKKLAMDKRLCDYIGVNDKTKVILIFNAKTSYIT
jgi:hypothetical protein